MKWEKIQYEWTSGRTDRRVYLINIPIKCLTSKCRRMRMYLLFPYWVFDLSRRLERIVLIVNCLLRHYSFHGWRVALSVSTSLSLMWHLVNVQSYYRQTIVYDGWGHTISVSVSLNSNLISLRVEFSWVEMICCRYMVIVCSSWRGRNCICTAATSWWYCPDSGRRGWVTDAFHKSPRSLNYSPFSFWLCVIFYCPHAQIFVSHVLMDTNISISFHHRSMVASPSRTRADVVDIATCERRTISEWNDHHRIKRWR